MDTLAQSIRLVAQAADARGRHQLKTLLRDISFSLDDEDEVVGRVGYKPLEAATVRIGIDIKLFEALVAHKRAVKIEDLAPELGVDAILLARLTRFLAANGYVSETGPFTYEPNYTTHKLVSPTTKAGICHMFDNLGPQFMAMPRFLKKTDYHDVRDAHSTVFQDAFDTKLGAFEWYAAHPENLAHFNDYMALRRQPHESWLAVYPVEEETKGWPADQPVFVNMGGGMGHQCAEFRARYPNLGGSVILQDLAQGLEHAPPIPGIESMVHDFFTPQPVKGAKYYYLRAVLHDWPDERVLLILQNIVGAMGPESAILVDEMVFPDTGVNANAAGIDLVMMTAAAAFERTRTQWAVLFDRAGLRIAASYMYKPEMYESVIKLVKA